MAEVFLRFELATDTELQQAARVIQARLNQLDIVEEAEATPEELRLTGVEVVAAISIGIVIVSNARKFVEELRRLIPEIKGLVKDLKDVFVEVDEKQVSIDKLTDAHFQQMEEE